ncbi:hypothetical protein J5I95_17170 [Candidatus Poribacteria bacterium]|nr:hypothetical protein [Candidatus Poribacteria bacterium]
MDIHDGNHEAALKGEKIIPLFMVKPEDFNIIVEPTINETSIEGWVPNPACIRGGFVVF